MISIEQISTLQIYCSCSFVCHSQSSSEKYQIPVLQQKENYSRLSFATKSKPTDNEQFWKITSADVAMATKEA